MRKILPPFLSDPVFRRALGLAVALLGAVLMVQTLTGVWNSDVGADPDEPAHAVTALMVRDYAASGLSQSPLAFAQQYYEDFPKVALGHYPPGYYALGGLVLLPWVQPQALLALQAVLAALLGVQVYLTGRRFLRDSSALAAGALSVGFPVTLKLTQLVMADVMLACLCLLAVECWARFLEGPRVRTALMFGLAAAAAILTKGSGLALALVPVVSVVMLGRWQLLKRPSFWLAGGLVGVLAGPWMLYSAKITQEGMVAQGMVEFATAAAKHYWATLSPSFGFTTVVVAAAGLLMWLGFTKIKLRPDVRRASLLGLVVGTGLIMLLIPAGYSSRYFMPVVPVVALLAVSFFEATLARTNLHKAGLVAVVLLTWLQVPGLLVKNVHGYQEATQAAMASTPQEEGGKADQWLVSADPRGEGAVIASAAFALDQRSPSLLRVHRGSKELATTDWLGRDYRLAYARPEEVQAYLDKAGIRCVLVDRSETPTGKIPHEDLLLETLRASPAVWKLEKTFATTRPYMAKAGELDLYVRQP